MKKWVTDPTFSRIFWAVTGLAIVFVVGRVLQGVVIRNVSDSVARYRARKFVTFAGYLTGIVVLVTVFSSRVAGLTVALGVAGAGVALALQEVVASLAGWFAISFGNFYSPGDRVQVGSVRGDVIDIGVLRTTIMELGQWVDGDLYNDRIVRIANSYVFREPVSNYSADFPFLWDEITLPVRYGSDWKFAKTMLVGVADEVCRDFARASMAAWKDAVAKYRLEDANVEPMVTLVANDNWLAFTIRYVVDYRKRRSVKDALFTRILEEVDRANGRLRLASATFELVNFPGVDVSFDGVRGTVEPRYVP
ncbi:MAG: mechanosensitive ion channel [Myxococcales bacterium]|nr:mechanosensitive ion channel [Myxococcales bacterium]